MLVWSFKIVKERQFLWATFCVLCLLENPVSGDENVSSTILPNTTIAEKLMTIITPSSASNITSLSPTITSLEETSSNATKPETFAPITPTTNITSPNTTAISFTTQWNVTLTTNNETTTTQNLSTTPLLIHEPTKPTTYNSTILLITTMTENNHVMVNITCMKIKQRPPATEVVCLELHEVQSCLLFIPLGHIKSPFEIFLKPIKPPELDIPNPKYVKSYTKKTLKKQRGGIEQIGLSKKEVTCLIELADSDMNHYCMLLLAVNNTENIGAEALYGFLDDKQQDLKAGEDPYYIENDSHGNSEIPVASQEQSGLQDKPNLNGGARKMELASHPQKMDTKRSPRLWLTQNCENAVTFLTQVEKLTCTYKRS